MAEVIDGGNINIEIQNHLFNNDGKVTIQFDQQDNNQKPSDTPQTNFQTEINVLDRVPADIDKAIKHGQAKKVAKTNKSCKKVCECCGIQFENVPIALNCDTLELSFLGPGIPLYFGFLKACTIFFIITALIYTTYGMYENKNGKNCNIGDKDKQIEQKECYKNFFNEYSVVNRQGDEDKLRAQNYINLGTVIALVITLHLYRRQVRINEDDLDFHLVSLSDFTVQLENLPPKYTQEDIRQLLQSWWDSQTETVKNSVGEFKIENICIAYDVKEYLAELNMRNQVNLQIRKNDYYEDQFKHYPKGQNKNQLLKKRDDVQKKIDEIEAKVFNYNYDKITPQCFVTFNTRKVLERLLDSQKLSAVQKFWISTKKFFKGDLKVLSMKYEGKRYIITTERAPEPSDVKWENCGSSNMLKAKKRTFTWFVTLILLGVCFVIIFYINQWQHDVNVENKGREEDTTVKAKLQLLSLFSSFSIVFINTALTIAMRILADMELCSTVTKLNVSVAEKLTIAQFCNSALLTLAVNLIIDIDTFWGTGGITSDFTLIAISNCIVPPLLNLFNPMELVRWFKRRSIRNDKKGFYSQGDANNWFEGSPLDIAVKYASCVKTLWMIGFYTPLSPYLPILGIITIFLTYWVDKYVLLNFQARPNLLGSELNRDMIELAEYFPFSIAIGNLVWMSKLGVDDQDSYILIGFAIGISAINFIIPADLINKMIFKIEEKDDSAKTGTYQERRKNNEFEVDYDRCNPITKEEAIKAYFKEQQENARLNTENQKTERDQANGQQQPTVSVKANEQTQQGAQNNTQQKQSNVTSNNVNKQNSQETKSEQNSSHQSLFDTGSKYETPHANIPYIHQKFGKFSPNFSTNLQNSAVPNDTQIINQDQNSNHHNSFMQYNQNRMV